VAAWPGGHIFDYLNHHICKMKNSKGVGATLTFSQIPRMEEALPPILFFTLLEKDKWQ
jgi:hypothetical protein